jgi:hypothetical protein
METNPITSRVRIGIYVRRAIGAALIFLVLLVLAGCLTSYAAGPSEKEPAALSAGISLPTVTPTASLIPTSGGTTKVPKALRVLQQATVTATLEATSTLTATAVPDTATPTPEPTLSPVPTNTPLPTVTAVPTNTPQPRAAEGTPEPFKAYAWLDNYYPAPGSVVTVHGSLYQYGRPVCGANMGVTFRYTCGSDYCSAYTDIKGKAACARNIGCQLPNYWAYVDVVFTYEGQQYYAKTGFLVDP